MLFSVPNEFLILCKFNIVQISSKHTLLITHKKDEIPQDKEGNFRILGRTNVNGNRLML